MSQTSLISLCQQIRPFANCYSQNLKRNKIPFVDFETGFPKNQNPDPPQVFTSFTLSKQRKLERLYTEYPQRVFKGRVLRQLSCLHIRHSGRSHEGRVNQRHRGGGTVWRIRHVDYKRGRKDIPATVLRIEYAPGRSAHLMLIQYEDGVLSYILAPYASRPGDKIIATDKGCDILPGNCLPLGQIPIGTIVHNIELEPGRGGQFVRAAGTFAKIINSDKEFTTIKLTSTEIRKFPNQCWATVGQVSNIYHCERWKGKAGVNRWLGWRPEVRGNAMNPSSHPHGGGTHAKSEKRPPVSPWGVHRQGFKTRSKKPLGLIMRRQLCNRLQRKFGIRGGHRTKYKPKKTK